MGESGSEVCRGRGGRGARVSRNWWEMVRGGQRWSELVQSWSRVGPELVQSWSELVRVGPSWSGVGSAVDSWSLRVGAGDAKIKYWACLGDDSVRVAPTVS